MNQLSSRLPCNPPDLITFRHNPSGRMVYVLPPSNYAAALSLARELFPEVATCPKDGALSLSITSLVQGAQHRVAISPAAWGAVLATLARFEIVDVHVQPERAVDDDSERLPMYSACARHTRLSFAQRAAALIGRWL